MTETNESLAPGIILTESEMMWASGPNAVPALTAIKYTAEGECGRNVLMVGLNEPEYRYCAGITTVPGDDIDLQMEDYLPECTTCLLKISEKLVSSRFKVVEAFNGNSNPSKRSGCAPVRS